MLKTPKQNAYKSLWIRFMIHVHTSLYEKYSYTFRKQSLHSIYASRRLPYPPPQSPPPPHTHKQASERTHSLTHSRKLARARARSHTHTHVHTPTERLTQKNTFANINWDALQADEFLASFWSWKHWVFLRDKSREFQTEGPETDKDRLPKVWRQKRGTVSRERGQESAAF